MYSRSHVGEMTIELHLMLLNQWERVQSSFFCSYLSSVSLLRLKKVAHTTHNWKWHMHTSPGTVALSVFFKNNDLFAMPPLSFSIYLYHHLSFHPALSIALTLCLSLLFRLFSSLPRSLLDPRPRADPPSRPLPWKPADQHRFGHTARWRWRHVCRSLGCLSTSPSCIIHVCIYIFIYSKQLTEEKKRSQSTIIETYTYKPMTSKNNKYFSELSKLPRDGRDRNSRD